MILTRDKGQRMWGGSFEAGGGGGGGMSPGALAGYATQAWVDENYVSSEYFKRLFQAFNGSTAVNPNDLTTAITNIKAMVDFWSAGGVSALGYNSGGGGGGATALTDLVDVQLTTPVTNGQALVYNSTTGKWENATIQASGGTVTSVGMTVPTGFSISGQPITTSGTLALTFASGYSLPTTAKQTAWDTKQDAISDLATIRSNAAHGETAYGWGNHANAGYALATSVYTKTESDGRFLTISFFRSLFKALTDSNVEVVPNDGDTSTITSIKSMFGFWTEQYLSALGKGSGGGSGATSLNDLIDVKLTNPSNGQALVYNATDGKWENATIQASGGTVTSVGMTVPTGFSISGQPITTSGTLALTFASGYSLPTTAKQTAWDAKQDAISDLATIRSNASHGETAYGWGNHASAGYWKASNHPTTLAGYGITDAVDSNSSWWGRSMVNGAVTGDMTSVGSITMSGNINMSSTQYIAFNDSGYKNVLTFNNSILSLGYGTRKNGRTTQIQGNTLTFRVANTESGIDAMTIDANGRCYIPVAAQGLRIGDGLITWDATNNALKVTKNDGTAANFYALGGVSALGMSAGTSSLDSFTFNYLSVRNELQLGNSNAYIYVEDFVYFESSLTISINGVEFEGYSYVRATRFYLSNNTYIYYQNGNLYYYNGTTSKKILTE